MKEKLKELGKTLIRYFSFYSVGFTLNDIIHKGISKGCYFVLQFLILCVFVEVLFFMIENIKSSKKTNVVK